MAHLQSNRYGKHRVRVLKVLRAEARHEVCELEADVLLSGDLKGSYLSSDNSSIVPTDTVKNTVQFLAHDHLETCRVAFARVIGKHFLKKYEHLSGVTVELRERRWSPMGESPHSFVAEGNGQWFARGKFQRDGAAVLSAGLRDHLIMKTTESGFSGYNQCELTTLPPTDDRILSTRLSAEWTFASDAKPCSSEVDAKVLASAYDVFSDTFSPSVQRTLFQIGKAALKAVPEITKIDLGMPNVHFLGLDLTKLGRPHQDEVFLPTDEPHGEIQATVAR